jgi:NADH-quinone oxidoreductase subunit J
MGFIILDELNPIQAVISLILSFCLAMCCLLFLNFDFFAIIFLIIYVGAIAVLFLFVVMMINIKNIGEENELYMSTSELIVIGLLIFEYFFGSVFQGKENLSEYERTFDSISTIDVLGQTLYNYFLPCFLIIGLVLLVALVGCIVLTLKFNAIKKSQYTFRQLARTENFLTYFR